MKETFYKLGEYKIIESDSGELRWEAHFGLGMFQEGRCFRKGVILFIGPAEGHHNGFLKLEFNDHLKKLSAWTKTRYYCDNLEVFYCKTGKKFRWKEMRFWMLDHSSDRTATDFPGSPGDAANDTFSSISGENVDFRIQKYEINKNPNGQVMWRTYAGFNILRTGECIILKDILFLGPWHDEQTDMVRQEFIANLKNLPQWDQTKYFCHTFPLHECKTLSLIKEYKKGDLSHSKPTGTKYVDALNKTSNELKISLEKLRQPFSPKEILLPLKSLAKSLINTCEKVRSFKFKFNKPDMSKSISIFHVSGIKKWLIYPAALILLAILALLFFLFDLLEEHHERGHYKKQSHPSSHRRDH